MLSQTFKNAGARGQALVETAIILPLILLMAWGTYSGATLIADKQAALHTVRDAARIGAEVGGSVDKIDKVDTLVVQSVLSGRSGLSVKSFDNIYIYQPASGCADGHYEPTKTSDLCHSTIVDKFTGDGILVGKQHFSLTTRSTVFDPNNPQNSFIGVQINYTYQSPVPFLGFNISTYDYAVMPIQADIKETS